MPRGVSARGASITKRGLVEIMDSCFGIDISRGTTWNMVDRAADACGPVREFLTRHMAEAPFLNADETGWKNNGQRRWLWTFVATVCVVFAISASRGAKVIRETLGDRCNGMLGAATVCWAATTTLPIPPTINMDSVSSAGHT